MRILLDTCVLFDIIAERMAFEESLRLLALKAFGDAELWVSAKSFTDIFYVMNKNPSSKDKETPDVASRSGQIQDAFLKCLEYFRVCSVDGGVVAEACQRRWSDFEDCLVATCAEKIGADYLVTRDKKEFSLSTVTAVSPKELFAKLEEQGIVYRLAG